MTDGRKCLPSLSRLRFSRLRALLIGVRQAQRDSLIPSILVQLLRLKGFKGKVALHPASRNIAHQHHRKIQALDRHNSKGVRNPDFKGSAPVGRSLTGPSPKGASVLRNNRLNSALNRKTG